MTALFIFLLVYIINGLIINRIKESNLQYFLLFLEQFVIPIGFLFRLKNHLIAKDYSSPHLIAFIVAAVVFIPLVIIFKRIRKNKEKDL